VINDHTLIRRVNLGCPQGGILSPFFWNILIDDLLRIYFPFPFKIDDYDDDIDIATSHKVPADPNLNLQLVCDSG
jgi:hypothetical protein